MRTEHVYFDVFGLFLVLYPKSLSFVLHIALLVVCVSFSLYSVRGADTVWF